ncbi:MAG: hypothetical protein R2742_05565 [Micropruina glycogenica]
MIRRFGHWLVALLACAAMIGLHAYTGGVRPRRRTACHDPGQTARLYASTVVVNGWSIGQVLYSDDAFVGRTGVIYLVVNVTVATDGSERSTSWKVGGESNGRTFAVDDPLFVRNRVFSAGRTWCSKPAPTTWPASRSRFSTRLRSMPTTLQVNVDLGITAQDAARAFLATTRDCAPRAEPSRVIQ